MGASVGLLVSVILHVPLLTWLLFTMEVANCFVNFSHRTCSITRTSLSSVRVTITLVLQYVKNLLVAYRLNYKKVVRSYPQRWFNAACNINNFAEAISKQRNNISNQSVWTAFLFCLFVWFFLVCLFFFFAPIQIIMVHDIRALCQRLSLFSTLGPIIGVVQLKNPSHELGIELPVNNGYVKTR